jgi:hypothetical protein
LPFWIIATQFASARAVGVLAVLPAGCPGSAEAPPPTAAARTATTRSPANERRGESKRVGFLPKTDIKSFSFREIQNRKGRALVRLLDQGPNLYRITADYSLLAD